MDKIIKTGGLFLLRRNVTTGDKTIFCGVANDNLIPEQPDKEELWICDIRLIPMKKFKTTDYIKGMRIDQILCSSLDVRELEEIPCDGEKVSRELEVQEFAEGLFNVDQPD